MKNNTISNTLESSIASTDLAMLSAEISESVVDSILDDGFLKELPVFGAAVGLFKIGVSIRERNYIKKLYKFLFQLKDVSQDERESFLLKAFKNKESKKYFFEKVLYIIDRLDDVKKSEVSGNLFKNLIVGNIETGDFLRLLSIVEKIYVDDLMYLKIRNSTDNEIGIDEKIEYLQNIDSALINTSLSNEGLLDLEIRENIREQERYHAEKKIIREYKVSKMGYLLNSYGFR